MVLTSHMPVPETNGEEWDRLEAAASIDALLELIMHGEYNELDAARRQKERVDLRATAVGVFEVCARSLVIPITDLLKPLEGISTSFLLTSSRTQI